MREVTVEELYQEALRARLALLDATFAPDGQPRIYLHWSAGRYFRKWDEYHVNITGDGKIYLTTGMDVKLPHTYKRNSGAVGISLCCAYGANTNNLGECPPTPEQIESMAQAVAAVADGLWLTICKKYVLTHGEAADNEDGWKVATAYGPKSTCERWDLEFLGTKESPAYNPWATDGTRGGDVLRGKANWYHNQHKFPKWK